MVDLPRFNISHIAGPYVLASLKRSTELLTVQYKFVSFAVTLRHYEKRDSLASEVEIGSGFPKSGSNKVEPSVVRVCKFQSRI